MPVALMVAIVYCRKFPSYDIVARLLLDFADSSQAGAVTDICPPSGKSPATIAAFSNQQDALIRKYGGAYINFWSGIPDIAGEQLN